MLGLGLSLTKNSQLIGPWWDTTYPDAIMIADFANNRAAINDTETDFIDFLSINRSSNGFAENKDGTLRHYEPNKLRISDKGLLIESRRTNHIINSQELNTNEWQFLGTAISGQAPVIAPDNSTNTQTVENISNIGDGLQYIDSSALAIANNTYTFSVYLRSDTTLNLNIELLATVGTNNPTITNVQLTPNWQRFSLTHSFANDSQGFVCKLTLSENTTPTSFNIWGAQLEEGSYPTSQIVTTGTANTREADAIQFTDLTWLDQSQGTILMQVQSDQGNINNRRLLGFSSGRGLDTSISENEVEDWNGTALLQAISAGATWITGAKTILSWNSNGRSLCIGGGNVSEDSESPVGLSIWTIGSRNGISSFWEGYQSKIIYIPFRLDNNNIISLTA